MKGLAGAFTRFRIMAWITGVLLAVMVCIGLPLRYLVFADEWGSPNHPPFLYSIGWVLHGWMFVLYLAAALDVTFRMKYNVLKVIGVAISGTIPFMSFVAEHFVKRDVNARLDQSRSATPAH